MSTTIQFQHGANTVRLAVLDDCSVSGHIRTTRSFYELEFLEFLGDFLPSDAVVFDVGAHIGNHAVYFAQVLGLRVVAFEPNPVAYRALVANVQNADVGDRVTCIDRALSDVSGTVGLAATTPSDLGTTAVVTELLGSSVSVQAARLDDYYDLAPKSRPLFLKIDVEGHEANVLRGGQRVVNRADTIGVSVECFGNNAFDACRATLPRDFRIAGLANRTPTVIFRRGDVDDDHSRSILVRYGIERAIAANRDALRAKALVRRLELSEANAARIDELQAKLTRVTTIVASNERKLREHEARIDRLRFDKQLRGLPRWLRRKLTR